jgi:hypothetical protein
MSKDKHRDSDPQGKQKKGEEPSSYSQPDIFGDLTPENAKLEKPQKPTEPPTPPPLTDEERRIEYEKKRRRRGVISLEEARQVAKTREFMPKRIDFYDTVSIVHERWQRDQFKIGFSNRLFVQVSLPHRSPAKGETFWVRENGNLSLILQPRFARDPHTGDYKTYGFPYGNLPRLILIYLCTKAVQLKSPEIPLGSSMAEFMEEIGLSRNGRDHARLKEQLLRLLNCHIDIDWSAEGTLEERKGILEKSQDARVASSYSLWWDEKEPSQHSLFQSSVRLSENIFKEIMAHPVPLDLAIIATFRRSPLAIDLYCWLAYRMWNLKAKTKIGWKTLHKQVGSQYNRERNFKAKAITALKKIQATWKYLSFDFEEQHLVIYPNQTSVPYFPPASKVTKFPKNPTGSQN